MLQIAQNVSPTLRTLDDASYLVEGADCFRRPRLLFMHAVEF